MNMLVAVLLQSETAGSEIYSTVLSIGNVIAETLRSIGTMFASKLPDLIAGLIVLILFVVVAKLLRSLFERTSKRTEMDLRIRILASRAIYGSIIVIGIFAALSIFLPSFNFSTLMTSLGLTSVVIGIAARDIVNNFICGVLILWQRPFQIGDQIFIGKDNGKVEFIGMRATNLRTDDGELVLIPNGMLYTNPLMIRGAGEHRRMTFTLRLPGTVDLLKAKTAILDAINASESVVKEPKANVLASEMSADGVTVNAAFWINTAEYNPLRVLDTCLSSVHAALKDEGIEPYETVANGVSVQDPSEATGKSTQEKDDGLI